MPTQETCFTYFNESIEAYDLPERFTFPFYYHPHPLALLAAKELQNHLQTQQQWQHNFGLTADKETAIGKMFGVLLVKNKQGEIGYLSAFSGKIANKNHLPNFVPPVFDTLDESGFFMQGQAELNQISNQITQLDSNPEIAHLRSLLKAEMNQSITQIKIHRKKMIEARQLRKRRRVAAEQSLSTTEFLKLKDQLAQESIKQKIQLKDLTLYWDRRIKKAEQNLNQLIAIPEYLKKQRKKISTSLQKKLFEHYQFLNSKGELKSLSDIFKHRPQNIPPAGSGECAAPKLLHYAFQWEMKPLAMAEFWWGESPKSEIKKHLNFYAACQGKCEPILSHMLEGMNLDKNPLLNNPAEDKSIDIVYEDEVMLVINKPSGLLSVPGKNIEDCVYSRLKRAYPTATGPLMVHRLDMLTSGLMLIALSKRVHKSLQRQFIRRSIKKRYVALLDGDLKQDEGTIELPLRVDLDDRPRQLVCYEHGKPAKTQWKVIQHNKQKTKVYFYPVTGRTHQLRVHAAHSKGLNMPILGDDLYGDRADRLYLHAEFIQFSHPVTREVMSICVDAEF